MLHNRSGEEERAIEKPGKINALIEAADALHRFATMRSRHSVIESFCSTCSRLLDGIVRST